MADLNVIVHCCFCSKETTHRVKLADGWTHRYDSIDEERNGFCPDHAAVAEFAHSQCPGCVGSWGECAMWTAFAFSGLDRVVTQNDLTIIRSGICPRRTNGTLMVHTAPLKIEKLDLSKRATTGGEAFANAIEEYCREYP